MTKKDNLILDIINENQLVPSKNGAQRIGFYDGFKNGEPVLYIYIKSLNDKYSIVRRRVKDHIIAGRKVNDKEIYAAAYHRYLEYKEGKIKENSKVEELEAKIRQLESKTNVSSKPINNSKEEKKSEEVATPVVSLSKNKD